MTRPTIIVTLLILLGGVLTAAPGPEPAPPRVPTTLADFFQPGSQPSNDSVAYSPFRVSRECATCHETDGVRELPIFGAFQGSMMAQAARDPVFFACLAIANQDAAFAGDLCLRCHTPGGWLAGRSEPTDGSALLPEDRDGVGCSACHRMVDPAFKPGISPPADEGLLGNISPLPTGVGGGNFVMDPTDFIRGPYADLVSPGHLWLPSPFHRSGAMCGTCHDVSNPVFRRQADGTYALTSLDEAHPTGDKYDMFPLERTFSEWQNSAFADGGVDMEGRFGGNVTVVSTCQDCHMPDVTDKGCFFSSAPTRDDLPVHELAGGNAWVQDMVLNLYPDDGLNPGYLEAGKQRAISMLERACSLDISQAGNHVRVRVTNETGHKLPSGYPEGRRIWLNVKMYDAGLSLIREHGFYNELTAELTADDTTVYETHLGADAVVAAAAGIPEGKGFHFALNNVVVKDNRIPPRGFSNAAFRAVQAAPVATTYLDGQYWSDTRFRLPEGAASVEVNVYYQTTSREYVEFLRYENRTNNAGEILHQQWLLTGMSAPVLMMSAPLTILSFADGDANDDLSVNLDDFAFFAITCLAAPSVPYVESRCESLDFDADGDVDFRDFAEWQLVMMR